MPRSGFSKIPRYCRAHAVCRNSLPVRHWCGRFLLVAGWLAGPHSVIAAAPAGTVPATDILNLLLGLGMVIAIFLALAWLLKRLSGASVISSGYLKVIDTLHLGTREKVILIKAAGSYIVLGIVPGSIRPLHILTEAPPDTSTGPQPDFKARLRGLLAVAGGKQK